MVIEERMLALTHAWADGKIQSTFCCVLKSKNIFHDLAKSNISTDKDFTLSVIHSLKSTLGLGQLIVGEIIREDNLAVEYFQYIYDVLCQKLNPGKKNC